MRLFMLCAVALLFSCTGGGSVTDAGSACPALTGTGTKHGGTAITASTTWKAADGPHTVDAFTIEKDATLTLEPCTEVRVSASAGISVRGKLVAEGTALTPIRIVADDATKPFGFVQLFGGSASLAYVSLENGGNKDNINGYAVLEARGASFDPRQEVLKVNHVSVKGSEQFGVSLRDGATFTKDSSDLVITGAKLGAIRTWPRLAGNIPTGSYTGNTLDEIVVMAENDMTEDTTFHERGVPYRLGDLNNVPDLRVGGSTDRATLTIEAGVTVKVTPGGRIVMLKKSVGVATGTIIAVGTAARPIVFTSNAATPAAGDWRGLWFDAPDTVNKLDFIEVKYAGGPSQANSFHCDEAMAGFSRSEDGAVLLFGKPASAFITHSKFIASAGDGITRAWSDDVLDLSPTNTFSMIAKCNQGYPRAANGSCPTPVPCVK